jgi:Brp/Blh family beta-carotene 15,15'-monooxygenase
MIKILKTYHTLFACLVSSITICLVNLGFHPSDQLQITLLIGSTLILGIPHGALDPIIIERYLLGDNHSQLTISQIISQIIPYLSLMSLTYLTWYLVPTIALLLFILMSIYHFGEGDLVAHEISPSRPLEIFARGGNFLSCRSNGVNTIFTLLVNDSVNLNLLVIVLYWISLLHRICSLYVLMLYSRRFIKSRDLTNSGLLVLEFVTVDSLFRWCPPLLAFTIYFNLFHSLRHMIRVAEYSYTRIINRGKPIMLLFTLLTILPLLVTSHIMSLNEDFIEKNLKLIFIGLSVLTTPHMVIVNLLD